VLLEDLDDSELREDVELDVELLDSEMLLGDVLYSRYVELLSVELDVDAVDSDVVESVELVLSELRLDMLLSVELELLELVLCVDLVLKL
jgi:hypothetical protein